METILHFFKSRFTPFLKWLPKIKDRKVLIADALAWLTWAFIVLPQWIAFASIAWLPPEYWLYTAIVTPIIAAIFGSSFHLISWPTTAISLVIFATISAQAVPWTPEYITLVLILTFLAWIYQLAFWLAKLWKIVNFVSHTVVVWFTAWAAILIVTSQIKYIFWIDVPSGTDFLETWVILFSNLKSTNLYIFLIWTSTLLISYSLKKFFPKVPNLLLALILWWVVAYFLNWDQHWVKFVAEIPWKLPSFAIPNFTFEGIKKLASWAFAVALLWLIEAISIGKSIASKSGQRINANQEFIWQWLSNIGWSFFSCYAWSGSFTRSWVNYSAWAKTPLAAIFAAIFLSLIILLIAPITKFIPVAAMWWVIILVWYWLINFKEIKNILIANKSEAAVLLVTFLSTLFLELEFAIYLWIILSLLLFLNRTSTPDIITLVQNYNKDKKRKELVWARKIIPGKVNQLKCPQLEIIRIDMSIYFGSVDHIQNKINDISDSKWPKNILIVAKSINFVDMTGAHMLEKENERLKKLWWGLYITWLKTKIFIELSSIWFLNTFWRENIFDSTSDAIKYIYNNKIDKDICKTCTNKIFDECWNKVGEEDYRTAIKHDLWKKSLLPKILGKVKNLIVKKSKKI